MKRLLLNCQTEDEAKDFVKQCYNNGIEWFYSACDSKYDVDTTDYKNYENGICYRIFFDPANKISFVDVNMNYCKNNNYKIIPYSEINKSIKEENKMQFSPNGYSYRGQVFRDIEDYAKYIIKCKEDDRVKAEQEKQDKLKAERKKRQEELVTAYNEYVSTCKNAKEKYENIAKQFIKEYGQNSYSRYINIEDLINLIWEN